MFNLYPELVKRPSRKSISTSNVSRLKFPSKIKNSSSLENKIIKEEEEKNEKIHHYSKKKLPGSSNKSTYHYKRYSFLETKRGEKNMNELKPSLIRFQEEILENFIKDNYNNMLSFKKQHSKTNEEGQPQKVINEKNNVNSFFVKFEDFKGFELDHENIENKIKVKDLLNKDLNSPISSQKEETKAKYTGSFRKHMIKSEASNRIIMKNRKILEDSHEENETESIITENSWDYFILPNSKIKIFWDIILFISILYYSLIVPLNISFQYFDGIFFKVLEFFFEFYYILDIFVSFLVPYLDPYDDYIKNYSLIMKNYLNNNLMSDILFAIPFKFILDSKVIYQPLRLIKILKINKCQFFDINSFDKIDLSSGTKRLINFFWNFLMSSHVSTCIWIFLTRLSSINWIKYYNFSNYGSFDIYVTSLYFNWTTIFTIGYGDITSISVYEKIFNVLIMVIGILMYSYTITSVGVVLASYDKHTQMYMNKLDMLDEIKLIYPHLDDLISIEMNNNCDDGEKNKSIYDTLYNNLKRYLHYDYKSNKKSKMDFINDLPKTIRNKLVINMHKELAKQSNFFKPHSKIGGSDNFISNIILSMKPVKAYKGETIFKQGFKVDELIFIEQGVLSVHFEYQNINSNLFRLYKNDYYGMTEVMHLKCSEVSVKVISKCAELYLLKKNDLIDVMSEFPDFSNEIFLISSSNYNKTKEIMKEKIEKISMQIEIDKLMKRRKSSTKSKSVSGNPISTLRSKILETKIKKLESSRELKRTIVQAIDNKLKHSRSLKVSVHNSPLINEQHVKIKSKFLRDYLTSPKQNSLNSENKSESSFNSSSLLEPKIDFIKTYNQHSSNNNSAQENLNNEKLEILNFNKNPIFNSGSYSNPLKYLSPVLTFNPPEKFSLIRENNSFISKIKKTIDEDSTIKSEFNKRILKGNGSRSTKINKGRKANRLVNELQKKMNDSVRLSKSMEKDPKMFIFKEFKQVWNKYFFWEKDPSSIEFLIYKLDSIYKTIRKLK